MTWLMINVLIDVLAFILWFTVIWIMVCNQWAYRDTSAFLAAIRYRPFSGPTLLSAFNKVSYDRHLLQRFLFRDPWKLYDPMVRDAVDNPKSEMPVIREGRMIEIDAKGNASYGEEGTKH